jgi:hypothetical protein
MDHEEKDLDREYQRYRMQFAVREEQDLAVLRDRYLSFDTARRNHFKLIIGEIEKAGERLPGFVTGGVLHLSFDCPWLGKPQIRIFIPGLRAQLDAWDNPSASP